jgi:hypothetical protein
LRASAHCVCPGILRLNMQQGAVVPTLAREAPHPPHPTHHHHPPITHPLTSPAPTPRARPRHCRAGADGQRGAVPREGGGPGPADRALLGWALWGLPAAPGGAKQALVRPCSGWQGRAPCSRPVACRPPPAHTTTQTLLPAAHQHTALRTSTQHCAPGSSAKRCTPSTLPHSVPPPHPPPTPPPPPTHTPHTPPPPQRRWRTAWRSCCPTA